MLLCQWDVRSATHEFCDAFTPQLRQRQQADKQPVSRIVADW